MKAAPEFQIIRNGLAFWQAYDPAVKTDLCCCAVETPEGLVFWDPVPLAADAMEDLLAGRGPRAIVLTSGNHERNAVALARKYGVEIWASSGARGHVAATRWFEEGETVCGAEAMSLEGFAPGETAFWLDGLMILGDALINVPPQGLSILPDKYCDDPKAGRRSLKKLLCYPVEILMFAHGLPLVSQAAERLAGVLE
jgi:hypothetical protein